MAVGYHDSETTTYNQPILQYPVAGLSISGISTAFGVFTVPLLLINYTEPTGKAKVTTVGQMPILDDESNLAYGGTAMAAGVGEVPKTTLEGIIDTPTTVDSNNFAVPSLVVNGFNMTYAELMAMYFEGRATSATNHWARINPIYFRDPFGRIYNDPVVVDFTATYVEGVPGRNNIQLVLAV